MKEAGHTENAEGEVEIQEEVLAEKFKTKSQLWPTKGSWLELSRAWSKRRGPLWWLKASGVPHCWDTPHTLGIAAPKPFFKAQAAFTTATALPAMDIWDHQGAMLFKQQVLDSRGIITNSSLRSLHSFKYPKGFFPTATDFSSSWCRNWLHLLV